MNLAVSKFRAHFRLGLTATKERVDGLTPLLHWCLGEEGFRVQREGGNVCVHVVKVPALCRERIDRFGKPIKSALLTSIGKHAARNAFLARLLKRLHDEGRIVLAMADRLDCLASVRQLLLDMRVPDEDIGVLKGAVPEKARAQELAKRLVLCSYGLAEEGISKDSADTVVFATPRTRVRTERRRRGVCSRRTVVCFRSPRSRSSAPRAGGRLGSSRARGAGRTAPHTRATRTCAWWFRFGGTLRRRPGSRTRTGRPGRRGPRRTESSRGRPRNEAPGRPRGDEL